MAILPDCMIPDGGNGACKAYQELEAENEKLKLELAGIVCIIKQYKQGDCLYETAGTGEEYSKGHAICQKAIKKNVRMAGEGNK